ncbi:hypothetical protein [Actinocatenispora rupis]|uniref:Acetyltransferase (GNAT) family protein n=1 Tax=Actinocatenispora rupis TaxID=519421 RepID=A0A8J3J9L2_9ACTN|nr:hypothetical protein [Actinocatenispora rupis]GID11953.1 hypothetical protein Aru02nite_28420 [Actinocatenispora rupis]
MSSSPRLEPELSIEEIRRTGPLVDAIYADILSPSFPPAELTTLAALRAGITAGTTTVAVALDAARTPWGAAVGEWYPEARVMLLGYMAARPGNRGLGVGRELLAQSIRAWAGRYAPCLVLAEVERPDAHRASLAHGDPTARLRFYQRYGARALDLPYFQPALRADEERAYGMLLITLHAEDRFLIGPDLLDAAPVRAFWADYLAGTEGRVDDPAATRLRDAMRRDGIRLRPLDEYRRVPAAAG